MSKVFVRFIAFFLISFIPIDAIGASGMFANFSESHLPSEMRVAFTNQALSPAAFDPINPLAKKVRIQTLMQFQRYNLRKKLPIHDLERWRALYNMVGDAGPYDFDNDLKRLTKNDAIWFARDQNRTIQGFMHAAYIPKDNEGFLSAGAVIQNFRRLGIQTHLLNLAMQWLVHKCHADSVEAIDASDENAIGTILTSKLIPSFRFSLEDVGLYRWKAHRLDSAA
jgi:hypothetical protein